MQEKGRRDADIWPPTLHLSADDFGLIKHVVDVLTPVRAASKEPSTSLSTVGDVVPTISSTMDKIQNTDVPSTANRLKDALVDTLSARLHMLLGTDAQLPSCGGRKFTSVAPNEFVCAAYLIPRYWAAMTACYGYSERLVATELGRIYEDRIRDNECAEYNQSDCEEVEKSTVTAERPALQTWVDHYNADNVIRRRTNRAPTIINEYAEYISDITGKFFTAAESRTFWVVAQEKTKYPRLCKIARLFLTVPASAIPQERQFP
eukprot:IDg496t1